MPDLLEEAKRLSAVEELAREFHAIYQAEAKRQGDVRHHDDYDALSENIKEFDRVLARYVLDREAELVERLEQGERALREIDTYACYGTPWNAYVDVKRIAKEALAAQQREDKNA